MLGIGGCYLGAVSVYKPVINEYKNQVDALTTEVSLLNSTISILESVISLAEDTIITHSTKIYDLESQISTLQKRVDIFYGDITVEQAKDLFQNINLSTVLDVRTVQEFDRGHIEGAINIPVDELQDRLEELDRSDDILVYCKSGIRSSQAVKILAENGFSMVYNMLGGIEAWIQAEYPLTRCIPCGGG
ncbi:MAG: rhodanese-like domain-containing protein [Candidatus Bathyarchaeota archaeon]|nr:rhodanese-like domain-containing protein [Candidatus Bathyarchaeota archaeon]